MKAKKRRILSVVSRRPYLLRSLPDCWMVPPVFKSSSFVVSTVDDDWTSESSVAALFWVVSAKFFEILSIRSVTLSCCEMRLVLCLCRSSASDVIVYSSALSDFSISNIVLMFALRNAWSVLENCSRCESTSFDSCGSFSSRDQSSSFSMHFLSCDNFARPASFNVSNSWSDPRNARISWNSKEEIFLNCV